MVREAEMFLEHRSVLWAHNMKHNVTLFIPGKIKVV